MATECSLDIVKIAHILVCHEVHNACIVGNIRIERSAQSILLTCVLSLLGRDKQALTIEAEDVQSLNTSSIGVNGTRLNLDFIGNCHTEADAYLIATYLWCDRLLGQDILLMASHRGKADGQGEHYFK